MFYPQAKTRRLLGALVALLPLAGCTPTPPAAQHVGPGRVHDRDFGFSFAPPPGWERAANQGASHLVFLGPIDPVFRANVNVVARPGDGSSLKDLTEKSKAQMQQAIPGWHLFDEGITTIQGREASYLVSTFVLNKIPVESQQYLLQGASGKVYSLTFTCTQEDYARFAPVFRTCAASAAYE